MYIRALPDPPIHFVPPLRGNRTIVIDLKENRTDGHVVFRPVVRDVDDPMAVFRYHLNCTDDRYLTIDPSRGNAPHVSRSVLPDVFASCTQFVNSSMQFPLSKIVRPQKVSSISIKFRT